MERSKIIALAILLPGIAFAQTPGRPELSNPITPAPSFAPDGNPECTVQNPNLPEICLQYILAAPPNAEDLCRKGIWKTDFNNFGPPFEYCRLGGFLPDAMTDSSGILLDDLTRQELHDLWWGPGLDDSEGWYGLQNKRDEYMVHGSVGNNCRVNHGLPPVELAPGIMRYSGSTISADLGVNALHVPETCVATYSDEMDIKACMIKEIMAARETHSQWESHMLGARQLSRFECRIWFHIKYPTATEAENDMRINELLQANLPPFIPVR